jgi:hypothetical protein
MKKKTTDYTDDQEFLTDLNRARNSREPAKNRALHKIWARMVSKQVRRAEEQGIAYITLIEAVNAYNLERLPSGKSHKWQFPAFFKQRYRRNLQLEMFKMTFALNTTHYQWYNNQRPEMYDFEDCNLTYKCFDEEIY